MMTPFYVTVLSVTLNMDVSTTAGQASYQYLRPGGLAHR
jgi:hypothetical protein